MVDNSSAIRLLDTQLLPDQGMLSTMIGHVKMKDKG